MHTDTLKIKDFIPEDFKVCKTDCSGRKTAYIFEKKMCEALWMAYANGRPLLVRGDPGTGKSEMAYAVAAHLGWPLVKKVIQSNTELDDLHFYYDAVKRLADAQVYARNLDNKEKSVSLEIKNYIYPGPIWWAFNWQNAYRDSEEQRRLGMEPAKPTDWEPGRGCVLLIDEIDKADPDLPNGLLETFGNRSFSVPLLQHEVRANQPVLTVITTNEERELPQAFLRRCLVIELELDKSKEKRLHWMAERGRLHFTADRIEESIYEKAAQRVWGEREQAAELNQYQPGLAEYLDLLAALSRVAPFEQPAILAKIAGFALKKG